jgi:molecular chaperone GrpE
MGKSKSVKDINDEVNEVEGAESEVHEVEEEGTSQEASPQETIAELQGALLRARADFDNFRKRTQRDIADARAFSRMSTVEDILPIYDTFKMALMAANANNADLQTLLAGLNMIQNQFGQSFDGMGITEINAIGQQFDPNLHEAVSEQFSDTLKTGTVISQHRCGFKFGERLLRPATVVVSKGPEGSEESGE